MRDVAVITSTELDSEEKNRVDQGDDRTMDFTMLPGSSQENIMNQAYMNEAEHLMNLEQMYDTLDKKLQRNQYEILNVKNILRIIPLTDNTSEVKDLNKRIRVAEKTIKLTMKEMMRNAQDQVKSRTKLTYLHIQQKHAQKAETEAKSTN